jgi:hypothetical protein
MEDEMQIVRALCDEGVPREERLRLLESSVQFAFAEPEHQVVFDSIRALLPRGPITAARLTVHLTKRGFPDIEAEKYLPPAQKEDGPAVSPIK